MPLTSPRASLETTTLNHVLDVAPVLLHPGRQVLLEGVADALGVALPDRALASPDDGEPTVAPQKLRLWPALDVERPVSLAPDLRSEIRDELGDCDVERGPVLLHSLDTHTSESVLPPDLLRNCSLVEMARLLAHPVFSAWNGCRRPLGTSSNTEDQWWCPQGRSSSAASVGWRRLTDARIALDNSDGHKANSKASATSRRKHLTDKSTVLTETGADLVQPSSSHSGEAQGEG